jgi:exodeoxyribonuclease III
MRIVSWNINSLRRRQDRLLGWIEETQPDIVCLQETKCTDEQFPELALRGAGYHSVFHGQKSYNGVAILSRNALEDVRVSLSDEEDDPQARVIAATIGSVRIYSVYAPNGQAVGSPAYDYKLKWYARLAKCLRENERLEQHLAVCGDFNVARKDEDVYDPELWRGATRPAEREFLRALEKNHPILTPTEKDWLESGQILGKICGDRGLKPDKLRDLHFDVLIALTARSYGALLITSNRGDFELINDYRRLRLEFWDVARN